MGDDPIQEDQQPTKKAARPRNRKKQETVLSKVYVTVQAVSATIMAAAALVMAGAQIIDHLAQIDLLDNQAIISNGITTILERPGALASAPAAPTAPPTPPRAENEPAALEPPGSESRPVEEVDLLPSLRPEPEPPTSEVPEVDPEVEAVIVPPGPPDLPALFLTSSDYTVGDRVAICFEFFDEEFNVKAPKLETHLHGLIQKRHRQAIRNR